MPRKKNFEDEEYSPIKAEILEATKRTGKIKTEKTTPEEKNIDIDITEKREDTPEQRVRSKRRNAKKPKTRHFACASSDQDAELDAFLARIKAVSGTAVSLSVLLRASIYHIIRAENILGKELEKNPPPEQAATHDKQAYAEFEDYWVSIIGNAVSKLPPVH